MVQIKNKMTDRDECAAAAMPTVAVITLATCLL